MKVGDTVRVTRDFPRIGVKAGDEALVRLDRGNGNWEVVFAPAKEPRSIVVISEWIEEPERPQYP